MNRCKGMKLARWRFDVVLVQANLSQDRELEADVDLSPGGEPLPRVRGEQMEHDACFVHTDVKRFSAGLDPEIGDEFGQTPDVPRDPEPPLL